MKKTLLFILVTLATLCTIYTLQIECITDISNGNMLFDYDVYAGAITGFEDRVILNNLYSIQEFEILEGGTLNRIAYFEAYQSSPDLRFYQDKLYVYNSRLDINYIPHYFFRVFDLTQRPMVEIAEFETPEVLTGYIPSVIFQGSYVYISFLGWEEYHKTAKYNLETHTFEGFVTPALGGSWVMQQGNTLLNMYTTPTGNYMLRFFEFVNDQMIPLNDFVLPVNPLVDTVSGAYLQGGSNFVFSLYDGAVVVDFSDVMNPSLVVDLRIDTGSSYVYATYFTGDYLVMSSGGYILWVYQRNEDGSFSHVGTKETGSSYGGQKGLYVNDNLIFSLGRDDMKVFDLSTPNIDEVYRHCNFITSLMMDDVVSAQQDDFYFLRLDENTHSYDIYSVLDNELYLHVPNEDDIPQTIFRFQIKGDKLYVLLYRDGDYHFEVYDIANQQANRVNDVTLTYMTSDFILVDDKVFFDIYPNNIDVFSIEADLLTHLEMLSGRLGYRQAENDFIITYNGNNIAFRDSYDYENIIFTASLPQTIRNLDYVDREHLIVFFETNDVQVTPYIYKFDLDENSISLFHTFPASLMNNNVYCFDGIITRNAYHEATSEYYTIRNDELVRIGEKGGDDNRMVWKTYFYPAMNKMVEVAWSGIWVYDFEYEEYVSESDIAVPAGIAAALHGNYPNPFNPSTTISFSLGCTERVVIDVYNVRGQRVRSLVDGVYGAGEHSVVWNGVSDAGVGVGSGVYFYRMVSGGFTGVRKMLLLK